MRLQILIFTLFFVGLSGVLSAQKKPLDHSVYDTWQQIESAGISPTGTWIYYQTAPQVGDGTLTFSSFDGSQTRSIARGQGVSLFGNGSFATFKVTPAKEITRLAKDKKLSKDKMPKDTAYFYTAATMTWKIIPDGIKFQSLEKAPILLLTSEITAPKDTSRKEFSEKIEKPKKGEKVNQLMLVNVETGDSTRFDSIGTFTIDPKGELMIYTRQQDSLVSVWAYRKGKHILLYAPAPGKIGSLELDDKCTQGAFLATTDTSKTARYELYYFKTADFDSHKFKPAIYRARHIETNTAPQMPQGYRIGRSLSFSNAGTRLQFSFTKHPVETPKDTTRAEDKFALDIWSYTDTLNMPQQLIEVSSLRNISYPAIYFPDENRWVPVGGTSPGMINYNSNEKINQALFSDSKPYEWTSNWEYPISKDIYLLNPRSGEKKKILTNTKSSNVLQSPDGKYIVYFNGPDKMWYSYEIATGTLYAITPGMEVAQYNDTPAEASSYGLFGWSPDFSRVYMYDKYDLWSVDPSGKTEPISITAKWGRKNNTQLRYMRLKTDKEYEGKDQNVQFINRTLYLSSFNFTNKDAGFFVLDPGKEPRRLFEGPYKFTVKGNGGNDTVLLYQRENFTEFGNLWVSDITLKKQRQVTDLNPQMKTYKWGTAELFKWTDLEGQPSEGILYKPEDYDPNKRYPVIVYFYETKTREMHAHHYPQPSWSIINPVMFTSNDYVIFVPDITYTVGYPGQSCFNKVVSGSNALIERGIANKDRMGLQGQSWGGYQVAYLVTQTNMFRCCSPGAAVSNMTSAYTGLRTYNGMTRMFMYECGQSRIGESLWESPQKYIENSPLFYIPKVNTPMLIRHSDADEAVPFAQGVELFMAMKRCGKQAWLLNYNKELHNLQGRAARKDWSIRMHQFFDYYLKDAPAPRWLKEGVSATEKGIDLKYDLAK